MINAFLVGRSIVIRFRRTDKPIVCVRCGRGVLLLGGAFRRGIRRDVGVADVCLV